ncbi:hypothetical protein [uncultured Corynebacterium sp.]|uniref:hypothetical protein n=1 Tax=uncultured Corynebacterium sp. TaxID=159447 RepID=UPI00262E5EA7|nr:hypothetical protein [uncultured Corynebacterium sp.]
MRITQRPTEIAAPTLTAAATKLTITGTHNQIKKHTGHNDWTRRAWHYYDAIGELGYVCEWIGASLSRVRIIPSSINPDTGQPTMECDDPHVAQIVTDIAGGPAGQATMLRRIATGLTVPGEAWIAMIVRETASTTVEEWHVLAADEINDRGTNITLQLDDGTDHTFNPTQDVLFRVHRPHPRNGRDSYSLTRSALPILAEIERTTAAIDGAGKSRLAGNGLLLVPQEISMPVATPPRANPDAPGLPQEPVTIDQPVTAADIMQQLQQVMTTAIADPTSAASMVPIVIKAPADALDKIRHIKLDSDVTQTNLETRDRAIRRLAMALDVPAEVLTGIGSTNHWSAWAIDESGIKAHIEPLMTLICDALTTAVLRPLLEASGHPHPEDYVVWFDSSPLKTKSNREKDAIDAFDRGAISSIALRRELQFDELDAADQDPDFDRALAIQLVTKAPSLFPMLANVIGINADLTQPLANTAQQSAPGTEDRPAPQTQPTQDGTR